MARGARAFWFVSCGILSGALLGCGVRFGYDEHVSTSLDPAGSDGNDGGRGGDGAHDGGAEGGADGGVSGDAGRDGGALPPGALPCGSILGLREDFAPGAPLVDWYAQGSSLLRDGQLTLSATNGASSYETTAAYDLRGGALTVELVQAARASSGVALRDGRGLDRFNRRIGASRGAALAVQGGELVALTLDGAVETVRARAPYDPEAHRHLRLREADGQLFWESSADRRDFRTLFREGAQLDTRRVFAQLFARGGGGQGDALFDRVNGDDEAVPGACGANTLRDDFDDGVLGPDWAPWNGRGDCTMEERGGSLSLDFPGPFSACALKTIRRFDLRGAAFTFTLASAPRMALRAQIDLRARTGGDLFELAIAGTSATLRTLVGGSEVYQRVVPFDAAAARVWRVRESDGQITWESSPDGAAWELRGETSADIDPSALSLELWGVDPGSSGAQTLRYDDIGGV